MDAYQPTEQSTSFLERFFSSERPGLAIVALGVIVFAVALEALGFSGPGRNAFQTVGRTPSDIFGLQTGLEIVLWLSCTIFTHILARHYKLQASFLRALRITGKAVILYILTVVISDIILIILVSVGWELLADFWYTTIRGRWFFIICYPAVIKSIYGPDARSCLMTFLTWVMVLLLLIVILSIYGVISQY